MQDFSCWRSESSNILTGKHPWCFFYWSCRFRVHPSNFIKKDSTTEAFLHGLWAEPFLNYREVFCELPLQTFFSKVAGLLSIVTLLKRTCLTKIYRTFEGDLYCVKYYSYIHMPILMPIPICPYQDFQVTISLNFVSFVCKRRS